MRRPNYAEAVDEDIRLIILKELAANMDGRSNSTILGEAVYACGHNKSPEYLTAQLYALADRHAVELTPHGSIIVAQITKLGVKHVLRQVNIEGVREPRQGV